jgi:hypothetical protein
VKVRISTDADAIKVSALPVDKTHPLVRKQLMAAVRRSGKRISPHDVLTVNYHFKVFSDHPEFVNKPHAQSSPQYSEQYVQYLADQLGKYPNLLATAREAYRKRPMKPRSSDN